MASEQIITVGVVGARGHVGAELLGLIGSHPGLALAFAASRTRAGEPVPGSDRVFVGAEPASIARSGADAIVLAVPDGSADEYADALSGSTVVVDLSSDHRFDDGWVYGLSEHNAAALGGATRISNPGCYATAIQLAIRPLLSMISQTPHAFGVSGYSGAGTNPSPQNDLLQLIDGVRPYKLVDHTHEREVSHHLGRPVRFSPHVAPFFRGITVTVQMRLTHATSAQRLTRCFQDAYAENSLIEVLGVRTPRVQEIANRLGAQIGAITVGESGKDIAVVCTIDNLLKGAASQAIQNLNLAFGFPVELGLELEGAAT